MSKMIKVKRAIFGGTAEVEVTGETTRQIFRTLAFWDSIPEICPVSNCGAALKIQTREAKSAKGEEFEVIELRCHDPKNASHKWHKIGFSYHRPDAQEIYLPWDADWWTFDERQGKLVRCWSAKNEADIATNDDPGWQDAPKTAEPGKKETIEDWLETPPTTIDASRIDWPTVDWAQLRLRTKPLQNGGTWAAQTAAVVAAMIDNKKMQPHQRKCAQVEFLFRWQQNFSQKQKGGEIFAAILGNSGIERIEEVNDGSIGAIRNAIRQEWQDLTGTAQ